MCKVPVRYEQDVFVRQIPDNPDCICRSHTHIRPGLYLRCRVDIAHHCQILILLPCSFYGFFRDHMRHRAVRIGIGHQHRLARVQKLCALPHKRHPAEYNCPVRHLDRFPAKKIGIAYAVGNLLYFRTHIVVRQYDCILFLFQLLYLFLFRHDNPPFVLSGSSRLPHLLFCSITHIFTADKTPVMTILQNLRQLAGIFHLHESVHKKKAATLISWHGSSFS